MAQKRETVFRKRVRLDLTRLARKYNGKLWFEAIQQKAIKGSPDFMLCAMGQFIGLELKDYDGIISRIQDAKMSAILEAGGLALVADPGNWANTLKTIEFYLQGESNDCTGNHSDA
jgi:hypothetical protein